MPRAKREPAYLAVVYHDEPDNAATDTLSEWHYSFAEAVGWARKQMAQPYWNGYPASVHYGYVIKGDGPARWEGDDRESPWLIYADAIERD